MCVCMFECEYVWVCVCGYVCVQVPFMNWNIWGGLWDILDGEKKQSRENILLSPPNFSFLNKTRNLCAVMAEIGNYIGTIFFFLVIIALYEQISELP